MSDISNKDLRIHLSKLIAESKGKLQDNVDELDNVSDPAYRLTLENSVVYYTGEANGYRKVVEFLNSPTAEPLVIVGNDKIRARGRKVGSNLKRGK